MRFYMRHRQKKTFMRLALLESGTQQGCWRELSEGKSSGRPVNVLSAFLSHMLKTSLVFLVKYLGILKTVDARPPV